MGKLCDTCKVGNDFLKDENGKQHFRAKDEADRKVKVTPDDDVLREVVKAHFSLTSKKIDDGVKDVVKDVVVCRMMHRKFSRRLKSRRQNADKRSDEPESSPGPITTQKHNPFNGSADEICNQETDKPITVTTGKGIPKPLSSCTPENQNRILTMLLKKFKKYMEEAGYSSEIAMHHALTALANITKPKADPEARELVRNLNFETSSLPEATLSEIKTKSPERLRRHAKRKRTITDVEVTAHKRKPKPLNLCSPRFQKCRKAKLQEKIRKLVEKELGSTDENELQRFLLEFVHNSKLCDDPEIRELKQKLFLGPAEEIEREILPLIEGIYWKLPTADQTHFKRLLRRLNVNIEEHEFAMNIVGFHVSD